MLYCNFRAHVLARYDGMESFATIIGTALSPVVFNATDYYGCYAIRWENIRIYPFLINKIPVEGPTSMNSFFPRTTSTVCAILYLLFVKEPHVPIKKIKVRP